MGSLFSVQKNPRAQPVYNNKRRVQKEKNREMASTMLKRYINNQRRLKRKK